MAKVHKAPRTVRDGLEVACNEALQGMEKAMETVESLVRSAHRQGFASGRYSKDTEETSWDESRIKDMLEQWWQRGV